MALIEEYYELNEAEEVSVAWKLTQITFYVFAGCFGLWCGYTMALLRIKFQDKCYLFTAVKPPASKEEISDMLNVNWESDSWCDYCQYSMVSSFIVATIWATFFLMCGKGGKSLTGLPQPWRIVGPSLIFNFIYFGIALTTALNIQHGTDRFCLRHDFEKRIQTKSLLDNCETIKYLLKKNLYITSLQLEIVVKTSWACAISWMVLFILSFLRIICVSDFHMYKVCVFRIGDSVQNKKEEVLRITNYEEPRRLRFRDEHNRRLSSLDEGMEDLEQGKMKGRGKFEKKQARQFYNMNNQTPIEPNTAFYITTDIRMLNRDKKRKQIEAFDKHPDAKKVNTTALSDVVYQYEINPELYSRAANKSLPTVNRLQEFESELESEDSFSDFEINRLMRFKKCL